MAKTIYTGVSSVARKVKQPYFGVAGVARKVKNGYKGVGGVARHFYQSGITLGELPVGTTVKTTYGGSPTEFIIVHQGNPRSSCYKGADGTWLWLKYELPAIKNEQNEYGSSAFDLYDEAYEEYYAVVAADYREGGCDNRLNKYIVNQLGISSIIKTVTIPYPEPYQTDYSVEYSEGTISRKLFLLSLAEMGIDGVSPCPVGYKLDYFIHSGALNEISSDATKLRKFQSSYDSTTYKAYWTRSVLSPDYAYAIANSGQRNHTYCTQSYLPRFACVLPSTTLVDDSFNIIVES